jgi:hypothetical protein
MPHRAHQSIRQRRNPAQWQSSQQSVMGVLEIALHSTNYHWQFRSCLHGTRLRSGRCHAKPSVERRCEHYYADEGTALLCTKIVPPRLSALSIKRVSRHGDTVEAFAAYGQLRPGTLTSLPMKSSPVVKCEGYSPLSPSTHRARPAALRGRRLAVSPSFGCIARLGDINLEFSVSDETTRPYWLNTAPCGNCKPPLMVCNADPPAG